MMNGIVILVRNHLTKRIRKYNMNEIELKYIKDTLHLGCINRNNEVWQKAFNKYGEKNKPKSMNCSPCYKMIYEYHLNKKK